LPSDEDIKVTLKEYRGQATKVSVEAPADVVILREELISLSVIADTAV